jgi:hypothetical protein
MPSPTADMACSLSLGQETLTAPQFFLCSLAYDVLLLEIGVPSVVKEREFSSHGGKAKGRFARTAKQA